jgi:aspartyl aminopeptidase
MARADMSPGSTIGPLSAAHCGIKTVDIGAPLLSMHSIRETVGARDHEAMTAVIGRHFAASPRMQR